MILRLVPILELVEHALKERQGCTLGVGMSLGRDVLQLLVRLDTVAANGGVGAACRVALVRGHRRIHILVALRHGEVGGAYLEHAVQAEPLGYDDRPVEAFPGGDDNVREIDRELREVLLVEALPVTDDSLLAPLSLGQLGWASGSGRDPAGLLRDELFELDEKHGAFRTRELLK